MSRRRFLLGYVAPVVALVALSVAPLITGSRTLFLRDVFNTHLGMKHAQAEAMRAGSLPLIDPYRAGGQPLAGNPNAVAFHPDNLLYLAASTIWALNAHFWLHLLAAPFAMYWLGRVLGLGRPGAWAAGVCYALSGFYVSQLSFYNLIGGVTAAPALAAAVATAVRRPAGAGAGRVAGGDRTGPMVGGSGAGRTGWVGRLAGVGGPGARAAAAAGALWALVLVSGDPLTAAVALALAVSAVWAVGPADDPLAADPVAKNPALVQGEQAARAATPPEARSGPAAGDLPAPAPAAARSGENAGGSASPTRRFGRWRPVAARGAVLAAGLVAGTLVALPQIVEMLRILPLSDRGYRGFSALTRTVASFDPRQALEWLLPFAFGRPDLIGPGGFWGARFYTGAPAYYFTLYPGLLALGLVAAAGRPRDRRSWWAWGAVGVGLFFSLGRFNPLAAAAFALAPGGVLRYPIKLWLPVAVGASVLCGIGFERATAGARRTLVVALLALAGLFAGGWIWMSGLPDPAAAVLRSLMPPSHPEAWVAHERLRWAGLCLLSAVAAGALAGAAWLARRRPAAGGALLLALHAAVQLFFLAPARPTDEVAPYLEPPPALAVVPPGSVVVHGAFEGLFGSSTLLRGTYPEGRARWLERRAFFELYPAAAVLHGRRVALDDSPEGLDSFYTRAARGAIEQADDPERLRLLAAWGVDRVVIDRPLAAEATAEGEEPGERESGEQGRWKGSGTETVGEPGGEDGGDRGGTNRRAGGGSGAGAGPGEAGSDASDDGGGDERGAKNRLGESDAAGAGQVGRGRLLASLPSFGQTLRVYAIEGAAPEVVFATRVERAPHMNAARDLLGSPAFDPETTVVLPGAVKPSAAAPVLEPTSSREPSPSPAGGAGRPPEPPADRRTSRSDAPGTPSSPTQLRPNHGRPVPSSTQLRNLPEDSTPPPARLRVLDRGRERLEVALDVPEPGVVVWQRPWLPLYRATLDGRPVPTEVANLHHLGVQVPAGRHRLVIATDRRPLHRAAWGSLAGAVALLALSLLGQELGPLRPRLSTPLHKYDHV